MQQVIYDLLYYIFILIFGVFSALKLACGSIAQKQKNLLVLLCPALLLVQAVLLQLLDLEWVQRLYPLITHLPIALSLVLFLRVKWVAAFLSVIMSYSLCQLMRWIGLVVGAFCPIPAIRLVIHLCLCIILLFLLNRYCLRPIHEVFCQSGKLFHAFGALPALYYIYEYFMIYTQRRYADVQAFQELLPTAMLLFFTLFTIVFQREVEKLKIAQQHNFMFEMELDHARREVNTLRAVQEQTAIYRHDMHHHLRMISSLFAADRPEQAADYIHRTIGKIESIVPRRYCENDTMNLLLGSFHKKAEEAGISMAIKASPPPRICLNDTELCIILSNGLENALNATARLPESAQREISVFIGDSRNRLLIEIRNPYTGDVCFQDGIPVAQSQEQHYGCRSIRSAVERRNGNCIFDAENGVFLLRIVVPLM